MKQVVINLQDYRTPGSRLFTGRDRGIEVRKKSKINEIEKSAAHIRLLIPEDIGSVNPSFLEGFLLDVVIKLGADRFMEKFEVVNTGHYQVKEDLEEAVDRILCADLKNIY